MLRFKTKKSRKVKIRHEGLRIKAKMQNRLDEESLKHGLQTVETAWLQNFRLFCDGL
jgi:hypothetical protein